MGFLEFRQYPLWINLAAFLAAALVVWLAGTRLTRYVDAIAERSGLGRSFAGVFLLGGITSLPEMVTIGTASVTGNAPLAVNNVFGGVAMQVAVLAVADAAVRERAISSAVAGPATLLQGVLLILLLGIAAIGIALGDVATLPFGLWSAAVFTVATLGIYLVYRYESDPRWEPVTLQKAAEEEEAADEEAAEEKEGERGGRQSAGAPEERKRTRDVPTRRLAVHTAAAGAVILVAGFVVARTADALAEQTGLGSNLVGAVLVAISTSLPEVSTTLAAVRMGRFDMAFSNVFGANLFDLGLLFPADVLYAGAPVLDEVGRFSLVGALLGAVVTAIYLAGIVMRRSRTVWRLGLDSLLVLATYALGLLVLYWIR